MHEFGHIDNFLDAAGLICGSLDVKNIEKLAKELSALEGRLFILGVGGSAGNASHAVNDFRKLCGIEAYAPTDNVSELTARTNDEGFHTIFSEWLKVSKFNINDALLIFSVGGGSEQKGVSLNLIEAIKLAKEMDAKVYSVIGKSNGYAASNSDIAIPIPIIEDKWITPLSEAFQAVIWHALVSHPLLQRNDTKW